MDEEKLEEIIERKVEERLEERLEKERGKPGKEVSESNASKRDVSRRDFLKKIGIGALGLSALSFPVSALDVRADGLDFYGGSGATSTDFSVDNSGNMDMAGSLSLGGDLNAVDGETIWDESNTRIPQSVVQQGSGSGLDADTVDGKQSSQFLRSDTSDSTSSTLTVNGKLVVPTGTDAGL